MMAFQSGFIFYMLCTQAIDLRGLAIRPPTASKFNTNS
jgi:hypothetical protein